jgi:DNA polymerase-3 subunit alpha
MNSNWTPLNCKTHYSLQQAFCKSGALAQQCSSYGYTACGIADIKTLSGAVNFHQECRKRGIKPIIGCDFEDYLLFAKNKRGWMDLIKYVSSQNLTVLKGIAEQGDVICVSPDSNGFKKLFKTNHFQYDYNNHKVYYVTEDEADCHRVLLCSGMKTTLKKVDTLIKNRQEVDNEEFFTSDGFHLPSPSESESYKEVDIVNQIASLCEDYEVADKPMLPAFECPEEMDEDEYLTDLCREGWRQRLLPSGRVDNEEDRDIYADRIRRELKVILKANLAGYFLIVQDIVNFVKKQGWLAGPGRGSAAGCLVSYLLNITDVDPIEYDLLFERFYNEGRNTEDYVSLPDIDMDVPAEHRDEVIDYIKQKYGEPNVAQMITFGRLQGRAAIKEVLRANDAVSFAEMNAITESIPDEAKISDQLELMDDKSIIKWTLENEPESLKNWCLLDDEGNLDGPLSHLFEQAIKIEGTNKSQGKHPAGVIISKHKLADVCPMTKDKSGDTVAAFDMGDLEIQGHVKFDVLGIDLLSKIMEISSDD